MSQKESEWEKTWEKFVLHDAVLAVVASPEVGDKFEPEKYNYANQKLNALNGYIYTRGKDVIREILSTREKEIAEEVKKKRKEPTHSGTGSISWYNQALDEVLLIIKK